MINIVMMDKNITIKSNPINTKEENILRRRFFTLKRIVAHMKKVVDVYEIDKEEFLFMAMETKSTNTKNEYNHKEKLDSKE
jgi:hypothetical protein